MARLYYIRYWSINFHLLDQVNENIVLFDRSEELSGLVASFFKITEMVELHNV